MPITPGVQGIRWRGGRQTDRHPCSCTVTLLPLLIKVKICLQNTRLMEFPSQPIKMHKGRTFTRNRTLPVQKSAGRTTQSTGIFDRSCAKVTETVGLPSEKCVFFFLFYDLSRNLVICDCLSLGFIRITLLNYKREFAMLKLIWKEIYHNSFARALHHGSGLKVLQGWKCNSAIKQSP